MHKTGCGPRSPDRVSRSGEAHKTRWPSGRPARAPDVAELPVRFAHSVPTRQGGHGRSPPSRGAVAATPRQQPHRSKMPNARTRVKETGQRADTRDHMCRRPWAVPHDKRQIADGIPYAEGNLMTAIESTASTTLPNCLLTGEVIDALAEGSAAGADRVARANALHGTIREIFETLAWRYGENADADELVSMRRVIAEAEAHLSRMQAQSIEN